MIKTCGEKETFKLARRLVQKSRPGDILCLHGNLGSGKTTLVKGLAAALGVKALVVSPTFLILKTYRCHTSMITNLVHIDAYRIEKLEDLQEVGFTEYANKKGVLTVIEWAEKIKPLLNRLNNRKLWIKIKIGSNNCRIFSLPKALKIT